MNTSLKTSVPLGYPGVSADCWDEVYSRDGEIRENWKYLLDSLQNLGPAELDERAAKVGQILRDEGATYNIYQETPASQTWQLDPIPTVLGSEEWNRVEAGLRERAELLDLILKDLYGPRELLKHNVIPARLIICHQGFLRSCQGIKLPTEQQLIFHSADMVRTAAGELQVLADRTQAPSGVGYALENRNVMARVFPSLFRDSHVHRLSIFFLKIRSALAAIAPSGDRPNIVVLTPGSLNETWFEHAYMANYLGYPLVQGNDLTVRDGYVWLKTLSGLSRVDVILRRVDDYFCDPVELKNSSQLGVPGLLHVVRGGRVSIANPIGAGVIENTGLLRYLPAAAQHFLGRDLRLNSVKTWWCGDRADCKWVLENLPTLVLKSIHRGSNYIRVFGPEQSKKELDFWHAEILKYPERYAAQSYVEPSRTPAWQNSQLTPLPTIFRSFAVAAENSYSLLPGGLTRVGKTADSRLISGQFGSLSKDTWVIASEPERQISLMAAKAPEQSADDTSVDLPSRVVENIYWMGRYAERTESSLRYLRTVFVQLNARDQLPPAAIPLLLHAVTRLTSTWPGFTTANSSLMTNPERELQAVIVDTARHGSVANCLESMLRSAYQVRDLLSLDTQRIINNIRDQLDELRRSFASEMSSAPEEELVHIITSMLALAGLFHESMVHGTGWSFMEIGRRLERATQTTALLRAVLVEVPADSPSAVMLPPLLSSLESSMTYQRRYHGQMNVANGLEIVLLDRNNPRSMIYQLEALSAQVSKLPGSATRSVLSKENRLLLDAKSSLQLADLNVLAAVNKDSRKREALDQLTARMSNILIECNKTLSALYFEKTMLPSTFGYSDGDEGK